MKNLSVVLVRAENPANIGHIARAMKNFGARKLSLVQCVKHKTDEAYTLGWKAKEILNGAKRSKSLARTLKGFSLIVGFSRRSGRRRGEPRSIISIVPRILEIMRAEKVALVFGNEKNGLSNEELAACHEIALIPSVRAYASLNLSHAVAVALFSIFSQMPQVPLRVPKAERHYASPVQFDELMRDFSNMLRDLDYASIRRGNGKMLEQTETNLRNYFQKAGLEKREFHLFKAFLAKVRQRIQNQPNPPLTPALSPEGRGKGEGNK